MGINKFNAEGYYDPTAYEAMTNVAKEEKAFFAFRPVVYICSPYPLMLKTLDRVVVNTNGKLSFIFQSGIKITV